MKHRQQQTAGTQNTAHKKITGILPFLFANSEILLIFVALLGNSGSWETPVPVGKYDASLAQLVEHDTLNVGVQGSSP